LPQAMDFSSISTGDPENVQNGVIKIKQKENVVDLLKKYSFIFV